MYTKVCAICKGSGRVGSMTCARCDGSGRRWIHTNSREARPERRERLELLAGAARVGAFLFAGALVFAFLLRLLEQVTP